MRPRTNKENARVVTHLPFVEQLARRVAATMPHSIDIGDLVQDGVIGLIDAAHRAGVRRETTGPCVRLRTAPKRSATVQSNSRESS